MATLTKERRSAGSTAVLDAPKPRVRKSKAQAAPDLNAVEATHARFDVDLSNVQLKKCARCGGQYPMTPEYWYLNRSARDGLHSYCRACRREYQSFYWTRNYSAQGREWRQNMLKPVDYVVLKSRAGGVLNIIYSGGGLAVGRIHQVIEGELPEEYRELNLKKLFEITTTETNYQRLLGHNELVSKRTGDA